MKEKTSRILAMTELVLVVAPITLLYLIYAIAIVTASFVEELETKRVVVAIAFALIGVFIFMLWWASIMFTFQKFESIRTNRAVWLCFSAVAVAFVSLSWVLAFQEVTVGAEYAMLLFAGMFGTPLLVPTVHLCCELQRTSR